MSRWSLARLESALPGFALGPVHLDIEPGRAVAVLGRSGAGKTTLLRTVAGFIPVRSGSIRRDGVDVSTAPPELRGIGFVPQNLGLFPHRTVEQNVRYPLELRHRPDAGRRAGELLERFRLGPLARRRPATLSSGERQKVALARALASEPELLLWDEPAHALDVESRDELSAIFRESARQDGVPLVVVTHDPVLAFSIADRFLLLANGRAPFFGDAAELLGRPPDAYAARFGGYENLWSEEELRPGAGGLAVWLHERAGPDGVAFPSPVVDDPAAGGRWEGIVDAVRPGPDGTAVDLTVEGLRVRVRAPAYPGGARFVIGSRVHFEIPSDAVRPLGGAATSGHLP